MSKTRSAAEWIKAILWLVPVFAVLVVTTGFVIAILATVSLILAKEQLERDLIRKRHAAELAALEYERL